jgi:hypothetical protein
VEICCWKRPCGPELGTVGFLVDQPFEASRETTVLGQLDVELVSPDGNTEIQPLFVELLHKA